MPIGTVAELRAHLELAIRVELTTIPPYLYAMYSLVDRGGDPARLIRSVVVEEMLHAALMGNLLVAVGGEPRFAATAASIGYPGPLPHHIPELMIDLEPCSPEVIERVFLTIERPEIHGAPPEPDQFGSLGQFYHALEIAVERLARTHDLFAEPRLEHQLADPADYQPVAFDSATSGGLIGVTDLESARTAIETVIHQGEGVSEDRYADPDHRELTHYAKFCQLADGTIPLGDVRPAVVNPTLATLPPVAQPVAALADALYSYTFVVLDRIYGAPQRPKIATLFVAMGLLGQVGRYLMTLDAGDGKVAGPPFRVTGFVSDGDAELTLRRLAAAAAADHPDLHGVADVVAQLAPGG